MKFLNQDTHLIQQAQILGIELPSQKVINQKEYSEYQTFLRNLRHEIYTYLVQDKYLFDAHDKASFQIKIFKNAIRQKIYQLSEHVDINKYDHLSFDALSPFNFLDYADEFKEFIPIISKFPNRLFNELEKTIQYVEDFQEILYEFQHPEDLCVSSDFQIEEIITTNNSNNLENLQEQQLKLSPAQESSCYSQTQEIQNNSREHSNSTLKKLFFEKLINFNFFSRIFTSSIITQVFRAKSNKK